MATLSELIDTYEAGPATLRAAAGGLTREQLTARPVPGKWSILEAVCHLTDFEPILADRMKRIVALDRPLLVAADENLFVKELNYHGRDVETELAVFESTRRQMAHVLRALPESAAARTGVHSHKGLVTLEQVLQGAVNHLPHHLAFVREKRAALGA